VNRAWISRLLTAALIVGVVVLIVARQRPELSPRAEAPRVEREPQAIIYDMFEAARRGDERAYLGCFTGDLERQLRQSAGEQGPAFREYLRQTNSGVKGLAVNAPQQVTASALRARVEYVYQDRNEAQNVELQKVEGQWKIARIESAERVKTAIPYGTPLQ
jgi:hypothetical protein